MPFNCINFGTLECPCRNCKDRAVNCHSSCSAYLLYLDKLEKFKKMEREEHKRSLDTFNENIQNYKITYYFNGSAMSFSCDDQEAAYALIRRIHNLANKKTKDLAISSNNLCNTFEIKDIKVNGPATIVFWADGTKTVVKCGAEDLYDAEKAVAMCFMKKALGGRSMHKLFDLAEDRKTEYDNQFTQLNLKEISYCLHDAISTILNQNTAKPYKGKIITDPNKFAEKMREDHNKDKE